MVKGLKTEAELNAFSCMLAKLTVETALNAELTAHFGHEKKAPKLGSNTRNGYSSKTVLCDDGEIELSTPHDHENTFEPQLIKKNQTRITQMDTPDFVPVRQRDDDPRNRFCIQRNVRC
ncbi:transposase [Pectobacterium carotovorum]|uniref:transposase n=1 Tax=Pectobacterium carotovorum TaxID=554 RepID=UPI0022853D80|nr:transposase [Pectobacterium carotovorum]